MCVSEGISVSQYLLSEEWELLKMRVSEIGVKRIRVNQGLGVHGQLAIDPFLLSTKNGVVKVFLAYMHLHYLIFHAYKSRH